jgi:bifunctional non-homologous end joining protein LigD
MRAPVASAPRSFVSPQLASLVTEAPTGEGWAFELKYDGYRMQGALRNGKAALLTRRGLDWSHRFAAVTEAVAKLKAKSAVVDGEVVVVDRDGRSSFRGLQQYLHNGSHSGLVFFVFDLLSLEGEDLRDLPFAERRAALKRLLGRPAKSSVVRLSEILPGDGERLLRATCGAGFEGVIGKRLDAPYTSGRSRTWVKVKCEHRQEFVVVGYTLPRRSRAGVGALLLAVHEAKGRKALRYAGAVGTGFSDAVLRALRDALDTMRVDEPPFPGGEVPALAPRDARWVRPRILAEVAFTEWTADGLLRHPSFQGLREDKAPRDIIQEAPVQVSVAGITISNPDRVVYPKEELTKSDVARHMEHVAKLMLPHVAGRPLSFVRCPEGIAKECFFQKHVGKGVGDAVDHVRIKSKDGTPKEYAVVHDAAGLVSLVQFGILEIHLWGCQADAIEKPDRVVFDLDPDAAVHWETTVEAALLCRSRLAKLELKSWPKTTGGKGVHVVVPIDQRSTWEQVRAFARGFAEDLEVEYPHDFLSGASKAQRKGKIFVDWLRNGRGSTWIAPWSMRARPGAPVSVPMSWATLQKLGKPDGATIETLANGRLGRDPWASMLTARQALPKAK